MFSWNSGCGSRPWPIQSAIAPEKTQGHQRPPKKEKKKEKEKTINVNPGVGGEGRGEEEGEREREVETGWSIQPHHGVHGQVCSVHSRYPVVEALLKASPIVINAFTKSLLLNHARRSVRISSLFSKRQGVLADVCCEPHCDEEVSTSPSDIGRLCIMPHRFGQCVKRFQYSLPEHYVRHVFFALFVSSCWLSLIFRN